MNDSKTVVGDETFEEPTVASDAGVGSVSSESTTINKKSHKTRSKAWAIVSIITTLVLRCFFGRFA